METAIHIRGVAMDESERMRVLKYLQQVDAELINQEESRKRQTIAAISTHFRKCNKYQIDALLRNPHSAITALQSSNVETKMAGLVCLMLVHGIDASVNEKLIELSCSTEDLSIRKLAIHALGHLWEGSRHDLVLIHLRNIVGDESSPAEISSAASIAINRVESGPLTVDELNRNYNLNLPVELLERFGQRRGP